MRRAIDADTATLWIGDPRAGRVETLFRSAIPDAAVAPYVEHFHAFDPWVAACAPPAGGGVRVAPGACFGQDLVPLADYAESAFYRDYARGIGLYHAVGVIMPLGGGTMVAPLGLHRPRAGRPFSDAERRLLTALLPHLRGALRLHRHLRDVGKGLAALDAMPLAAFVLNASRHLGYANEAAARLAAAGDGVRLVRSGPPPDAPLQLVAARAADGAALAALVRRAAMQGETVGLRLGRAAGRAAPALCALATPLLGRAAAAGGAIRRGRLSPPAALLLIRDPAPARPAPGVLADLFGLTPAEADIAATLAGGLRVQAVAAARGVGIETVRSQVRAILGKTGATNLRDLERLLAALPQPLPPLR